jgi:hypothetical protein
MKATGAVLSNIVWIIVLAAGYTLLSVAIILFSNPVSVIAVAALIVMVLGIATMYVIPVLVLEKKDLGTALPESLSMFKKTWGETVTGGGFIVLTCLVLEIVGISLIALIPLSPQLIWIGLAILFLASGVFFSIATAVSGIFLMGLYSYAKSGTMPAIFDVT